MPVFFALLLALFSFLLPMAQAGPNICQRELRAILDLGSGTTKLTLAEIERCGTEVKFLRVVDDSISRPLGLEAAKDKMGNIPVATQKKTVAVLKELKAEALKRAKSMDPPRTKIGITVVGTHAFRTARNQSEFRRRIERAGFSVRALSQLDEGKAGLDAVLQSTSTAVCKPDNLLAWDIGGGSMQLSKPGHIYGIAMGAEGFRSHFLTKMKPVGTMCASKGSTPNPIGSENFPEARAVAVKTAQQLLKGTPPPDFSTACVVGVGGVHNKAIEAQVVKQWSAIKECSCADQKECAHQPASFTKRELVCLAKHLSSKSDCDPEISGPYAGTNVTNLYFVLGWMDILKIDRVHTASINIGQALVTSPLEFRGESEQTP